MAKKSQSAESPEVRFAALVQEKMTAGLNKADAETCAKAQMEHDAKLAAAEEPATAE